MLFANEVRIGGLGGVLGRWSKKCSVACRVGCELGAFCRVMYHAADVGLSIPPWTCFWTPIGLVCGQFSGKAIQWETLSDVMPMEVSKA